MMRLAIPLFFLACKEPVTDADGDGSPAAEDCDDNNNLVHPDAIEQCDELDNDCDTEVDEGLGRAYWIDADEDGYGISQSLLSCRSRAGLSEIQGDCDDTNPDVNPDAKELCNGYDDDCDGVNPTASDWYTDADDDNYGDPTTATSACEAPDGMIADGTDCDDDNALAHPGLTEDCANDFDDDCDGAVGDGSDADGDGYLSDQCPDGPDCDDTDPDVSPDGYDACEDGIDGNCDGDDTQCGFHGEFDLLTAGAILTSEAKGTEAGTVVGVGDANGDTVDDVFVAAPAMNGGFFVPGPILGTSTFEDAGHTISGSAMLGAGRSLGVGDVDGDGLADVALGAPDGDLAGQFVLYGPIGADVDLDTQSDVQLLGEPGTAAGHGSDLSDIDGDGLADSLVGAYEGSSVYVTYGPLTSATVDLEADADHVLYGDGGAVVHGGGDVNGDGFGDLAISATASKDGNYYAGGVYVVSGPVSVSALDDAVFLAGPESYAYAGGAFALGDYNGDGFGDLAAWATKPLYGGVFVVFGPITADGDLGDADVVLEADDKDDFVGMGVGTGDADGDGVDEILVGAPGDDQATFEAGATYVVYDPPAGTWDVEDAAGGVLYGGASGDSSGMSNAIADFDHEGYPELVIGAPGMDNGGGLSVAYALY
jgi:hypothetical protein